MNSQVRAPLRATLAVASALALWAIPLVAAATDTNPISSVSSPKPAAQPGGPDVARPAIMRQAGDAMATAAVGSLQPRGAVVPLRPRAAGAAPTAPAGAAAATATGPPTREVFGFALASNLGDPSVGYTTWNFSLLSTVAFFGLHVNAADGSLVQGDTGWNVWHSSVASGFINTAHGSGVRVVLSVIFQDQSGMCSALDHGATTASQVAAQLMGADGVNIDYEGANATCPDGVSLRSKVVSFTQAMRAGLPGYLSIDTYAGSPESSGGFFDIAALASTVNSFFVMDYDLERSNGPCSTCIGAVSPLGGAPTYAWNVTRSANDYLPWSASTILGFPYYGVKGCTGTAMPPPSPGPNAQVAQFEAEQYASIVTLPTDPKVTFWSESRDPVDPAGQEPWATYYSGYVNCEREEYWDDPTSLGLKYDLVNTDGFRGAGIFTLDYGGGAPELWQELAQKFRPDRVVSRPATASPAPGRVDVFWRGADNALWHRWLVNATWQGPESLGGSMASDPTTAVSGSGVLDVFWKGTDGNLWDDRMTGGTWSGPQSLGDGVLGSGPQAVGQPNGVVDVFWRGGDRQMWHAWYVGAWYGPQPMGGSMASDPSPVLTSRGVLDVFWKGTDGALWHRWYVGGWYGPGSLGGAVMGSGPAAAGQASGEVDVFWAGTDANLWRESYVSSWSGPQVLL